MHCPTCGGMYREGVEECVDCRVPLVATAPGEEPRRVREPRFPKIPKSPDDRPRLVRAVPVVSFFIGLVYALSALFCLLEGMPEGTIRLIPSEALSAALHSSPTPPFVAAFQWAAGAFLAFLIAHRFWLELPSSRHLLIAVFGLEWILQLVGYSGKSTNLIVNSSDTGIPSAALLLAFLGSYFYLKPNVVSYFHRLERERAELPASQSAVPEPSHGMSLTLHYTEPLVRRAVRRFCVRSVGWVYPMAVMFLATSVTFGVVRGNRSWTIGSFGAVLFFSILIAIVLYRNQLAAAMDKFRSLEGKPVAFGGSEDSLSVHSQAGSAELPWRAIPEVWRYEDFWLLVFSRGHFMTLPLDGVPAVDRAFLLERVTANGGKIS